MGEPVVFADATGYNEPGGNMNFFKTTIFILIIILLLSNHPLLAGQQAVVIAMCGPTVKQIKNINLLYERSIINCDRIKLLCLYHQDERIYHKPSFEEEIITDYRTAIKYVEEEGLGWVYFITIKGKVGLKDLFRENTWTSQFREVFDQSQGVIFTGGSDIPPSVYGQENSLLTSAATPVRSFYECSFLFHLLGGSQNPDFPAFLESKPDYAVLGICLGAQTMNVATGGTLYQDIPSQIYQLKTVEQLLKLSTEKIHSSRYIKKLYPFETKMAPAFHRIKLEGHHPWIDKMGMRPSDTPSVLSSHHQSIQRLGKNLVVAATSMDGKVIEAIVHSRYKNVLGVQFHPENFHLYKKGSRFKTFPGKDPTLNLRRFLHNHPPSMKFHRKMWKWFSEALLGM
jgi:putative glutamine amidotransferase